jgi:uncharacterized membrane protein YgcG
MTTRTVSRWVWASAGLLAAASLARPASAGDVLNILEVKVDPPTLHTAGVQVLISDDDNRNATISVRYREVGAASYIEGPPLLRVWPETVSIAVPQQLAGSVFDLKPGTDYEIELHAVDPDGGVDEIKVVTASTRPVPPLTPKAPVPVEVANVAELKAALSAAQPGHVITVKNGTYTSEFSILASGTPEDPIIIRGESQDGVILNGSNCSGCNVFEVYGSYVHLEKMTLESAVRAVRFQGDGAKGNVARRLAIRDVVHGIGSKPNQEAFTICDNIIEGRLAWPWPFAADATSHWDDQGVAMDGDGHVVCHNVIRRFGDPMISRKVGARSIDFYGNDIAEAQDGTELDAGAGNIRCFHNRFTNVMAGISIQPSHGGPAYVLRNVVINAADEPIKLKSLGGVQEPSGALIYHNTFVSPKIALNLQTPITQHNFVIANNIFMGPEALAGQRTVEWTAKINQGVFDYNGYYPDGGFWLGVVNGSNVLADNFAALMAGGIFEMNGALLDGETFASGAKGPADPQALATPVDVTLSAASKALDRGLLLAGINAKHAGKGPDLGALEAGCPTPEYGPRPEGSDDITWAINCGMDSQGPTSGAGGGGGGGGAGSGGAGQGGGSSSGGAGGEGGSNESPSEEGDCGCRVPGGPNNATLAAASSIGLLVFAALSRRSRRRRA